MVLDRELLREQFGKLLSAALRRGTSTRRYRSSLIRAAPELNANPLARPATR
jgi:hypothetical protein